MSLEFPWYLPNQVEPGHRGDEIRDDHNTLATLTERVAASEADVQLSWGEPPQCVRERIERLTSLEQELGREHPPLGFGLRGTTLVRDTTEQAWVDAEAKVVQMAKTAGAPPQNPHRQRAVGQQLLPLLRD